MLTPSPSQRESPECFSTAQRFAWVLHPYFHSVPLNGSLPQQECWPATIRELSTIGVRLVLRREYPVGETIELHLHTEAGGCVRQIPATVTDARYLDGQERCGRWLLRCDFFEPLTADELRVLQAS